MMKKSFVAGMALGLLAEVSASAADASPELDKATVAQGAAFSRRAAAESLILLKNKEGALPLAQGSKVALFDVTGKYRAGGGGSSAVKAVRVVNVPDGIAEAGFVIDPESRETAIMVIERGSSEGRENSEKWFDLSQDERDTLARIKAAGFQKTVVVCNSGHVLNLAPLADDPAVSAILWTWYPGGEGGAAVGDVLSGKVNPSGRLAATFARAVSDWPSDGGFLDYRGAVPYEDDIFVGYRYFETIPGAKEKVVYPFGFGLSYTTWKVEPISCAETSVQVRVTNTGNVAGKRSVLCYTSQKGGVAQHPALELRAFAKTRLLNPGESEELTLSFVLRDLAFFDEDGVSGHPGAWVLDKGDYTILVGGSVRDVVPAGSFTVAEPQVLETPGFKLKADLLARRLNADGTYTTRPVAYPTRPGKPGKGKIRKEPVENPTVTLYDVADGKATLDELLDQMTIQEMLFLCYGHPKVDPSGTGSIGALEKFGVSAAQTCDGPAGIRRSIESTYFPCAALLASAFDPALMREVGEALGREAAETDFDILLAPGLCIHRHPLCGRNFEYFSEDPLVAGVSASEYVKGVQAKGVGATLKHFAGNNRETTRRFEKDIVGERAFREIYLRGFERAVKEAKPWAIMSAYSGLNGYNSSEHYGLLTGILRDEWGFDGIVMSDWHTTVPLWREVAAGNDVKMDTDRNETERRHAQEGFGIQQAETAANADYLMVESVRESAKRVCQMVMKTHRFNREKEASGAGGTDQIATGTPSKARQN
jgi:beta-glucosidase